MKRVPWMTPGEHRLAVLLLLLALLGALVQGLKGLDPRLEAWLHEPLPDSLRAEPQVSWMTQPRPDPTPVDPNTATEERLQDLPGVGPTLAKRIMEHRPYNGPRDLLRVPGIGEVTLSKMLIFLDLADSSGLGQSPQPLSGS